MRQKRAKAILRLARAALDRLPPKARAKAGNLYRQLKRAWVRRPR